MVYAYDGTSRRLSDSSSSDPSISSWTATKWLGSDFCLPQVPEGGFVRTQRTPPPYGPGDRCDICMQACQLSRIFRESHGFTDNLTLSRVGYSNSRILVVEEDKFAREPYKAKYLKSNVYPDPFASILSCARGRKAFPCCNPSINGAISGRRHPRVTVRRIKGNASTSSSLSVNDITLWMTDAVHKVISLACLHSNRFCLR